MNSPNAIAGNEISKCDTSSAEFQSENSRSGRWCRDSKTEILGEIRTLDLHASLLITKMMLPYEECTDDLNRVCADLARCSRRYCNCTCTDFR